jgi:hypothetical protein
MVVSAPIKVPLDSDQVQDLDPELLVLLDGAPVLSTDSHTFGHVLLLEDHPQFDFV